MALCDARIYRFVANTHFDYLKTLSPLKRASEVFKLEAEALSMELTADDEIFGWMIFDNRNFYGAVDFAVPEESVQAIINAPDLHGSHIKIDRAHTIVDYKFILENGLVAYQQKIENELLNFPHDEQLLAMKDELVTVERLTERMRSVVSENANGCKNAKKIRSALDRVPFYPARDFREAIQSIWIIHFLLPLAEHAFHSISLGKFDQYVYPYYQRSLSEGMTREEAKGILHNFYKLLNSYADGACLLNVGAEYNELSELIIECQRDFGMPAPILGARISENTPDKIWDMLIDEKLFTRGQPTFYGERSCVAALVEKGVPHSEALGFCNSSCMGISLAGQEYDSMWGCVFSVSAALEAALNCGGLLHRDITVPGIKRVNNLDELYDAFEKSAEYLIDICSAAYEAKAKFVEENDPDPFVSILTNGCIEKHLDRMSGAKYHNVTIECMGMVNASDGIGAIDRLVFDEKKYTIEQINEAVKNNFEGYDSIKSDILNCKKYGENSYADSYAVKVAEILQMVIRKKDNKNFLYSPSLHTLDENVRYGKMWGAGYDGRRAGAPFAKNAAYSDCVGKKEPTSLTLSAAKLPQHKFFGGQPIDLNFSADIVRRHKREIALLIDTYLQMGGLQLQVNSLSPEILRDALKNPERYSDLVVRVGGYSTYFNLLSDAVKEDFIRRAETEAGI